MRPRKEPGHAGARLREWLARWLGVGKAQRLRTETQAEALSTAYRHKLVAELHNLKTLDMAKPLDLETTYVPLQVSVANNGESHPHIRKAKGVGRKARAMPPEEALVRFHRLAVLGAPGAGKTTMLRHLTLLSAQGRLENVPDFPILVPLGHFAAVPQVDLLDFAISEIETRYDFPGPRPDGSTGSPRWPVEGLRPYLEERLEKGSVLLLLDGLDEANIGRPQEAEATYRHVVGQINVLAARYPNCPMVVTAGRESWKGLLAASFYIVEVLDFNRDGIQRFIVNWFGTGSDRVQDLEGALFHNPHMWARAANPLLLSLMAFAFERDRELPKGPAGLYRHGAELLFEHHDLERAHLLTIEQKRSLLEEVALHFHLRRVLLFPKDELREVMVSYLPTVDIPADQIPTILEEISSQHGLLQEQVGGWVGFPHPTWQEYFAAVALSKRGQLEWILDGLHDPWWEGTVLFLAGVLKDATPLLEGILVQEEDIFHSNLMLAGRCLAGISRIEGMGPSIGSGRRLWEDIVNRLKGLVERGHHRLLQRQAIGVLTEIGGEATVSFLVTLLRREEIDLGVRAEVAEIVGSLHDKSVIPNLLAFLTDQKLDPSVRGNIADALGSLGDESVIPLLLALLPDETVDPPVRGKVVEALSSLGGESVVLPFLTYLSDEGIDPYVREKIIEVLASLGAALDESLVSQLLSLLPDEKIPPSVRRGVAEAVGSLGDASVVPDLLAFLADEKVEASVRAKAAKALGTLGTESTIPSLLTILSDEKVNYSVRMTVAEVIGALGDELVASQLLALLPDEKIDPAVRASIAGALGILGEKSVVPQLLSLLPDERIDPSVRWKIVDALSSLGEKTIIPHLRALLPDEKIDSSVRWVVAEALEALTEEPPENGEWRREDKQGRREEPLDWLDDRSRVPQLLALLTDERKDPSVSGRIINALDSLGDDRATVEGLAALLDREDIGSDVYEALFHVSQRAGVRVFARKGGGYEVRPLDYALRPFDGTQGRLCSGQARDKPIGVERLRP